MKTSESQVMHNRQTQEVHIRSYPEDGGVKGRDLTILEKGGLDVCKFEQNEGIRLPKPIVVDSGAGETVIPEDWLPAHETKTSPGSLKNEYYMTADGGKVYNQGQKSVVASTADGKQCRKMTFQVAPGIQKALGSVSQME